MSAAKKTVYIVVARVSVPRTVAIASGDLRVQATWRELDRRVEKRACDRCYYFANRKRTALESTWRFDTRKAADKAAEAARGAGASARVYERKDGVR